MKREKNKETEGVVDIECVFKLLDVERVFKFQITDSLQILLLHICSMTYLTIAKSQEVL